MYETFILLAYRGNYGVASSRFGRGRPQHGAKQGMWLVRHLFKKLDAAGFCSWSAKIEEQKGSNERQDRSEKEPKKPDSLADMQ